MLRKTIIRSEKQHIYTNIYNKSLANAKPNQKQEEEIYSNSKRQNGQPQNKTKIKIFLWKKSNTPDGIGLNQVLKKTKFKKIMITYLLINIDFQKNLSNNWPLQHHVQFLLIDC